MKNCFLMLVCLFLSAGCTYFAPNKAKLQQKIEERGRELNSGALTAVREAQKKLEVTQQVLNTAVTNTQGGVSLLGTNFNKATNSLDQASKAAGLTESLLNRNENLQGKPVQDQTEQVRGLLGESTVPRIKAGLVYEYQKSQEMDWIAKEQRYEDRLMAYGTKFEQERNEKITTWLKWGSILFLVIAIPIALCVFFPPALSLLVGMVPKLAGLLGSVPTSVAANAVKAVGDIRWDFKKKAELAPGKTYTAEEVQAVIDASLKEHIDDHPASRNVINYLREKHNV